MKAQIMHNDYPLNPMIEYDHFGNFAFFKPLWHCVKDSDRAEQYGLSQLPIDDDQDEMFEFIAEHKVHGHMYPIYDYNGYYLSYVDEEQRQGAKHVGWAWFGEEDLDEEVSSWPHGEEIVTDVKLSSEQARERLVYTIKLFNWWAEGHCWYVQLYTEEPCEKCGHREIVVFECGDFFGEELEETGILHNFNPEYTELLMEAWENRYAVR